MGPEHRLAVYGTLAPGRVNHHEVESLSGTWTLGTVRGRLAKIGWGVNFGYPGLILDDAADPVEVHVLESTDLPEHWARLDDFEGPGYARRIVTVETGNGGTLLAQLYAVDFAN